VIEGSPTDLEAEITAFRKVVYDYEAKSTAHIIEDILGEALLWSPADGDDAQLHLVQRDGTPLRARATVTFVRHVDPRTAQLEMANESPDMTIKSLFARRHAPSMTYRVYGDARYYLEVARINQLTELRKLRPGTFLSFPPLS